MRTEAARPTGDSDWVTGVGVSVSHEPPMQQRVMRSGDRTMLPHTGEDQAKIILNTAICPATDENRVNSPGPLA